MNPIQFKKLIAYPEDNPFLTSLKQIAGALFAFGVAFKVSPESKTVQEWGKIIQNRLDLLQAAFPILIPTLRELQELAKCCQNTPAGMPDHLQRNSQPISQALKKMNDTFQTATQSWQAAPDQTQRTRIETYLKKSGTVGQQIQIAQHQLDKIKQRIASYLKLAEPADYYPIKLSQWMTLEAYGESQAPHSNYGPRYWEMGALLHINEAPDPLALRKLLTAMLESEIQRLAQLEQTMRANFTRLPRTVQTRALLKTSGEALIKYPPLFLLIHHLAEQLPQKLSRKTTTPKWQYWATLSTIGATIGIGASSYFGLGPLSWYLFTTIAGAECGFALVWASQKWTTNHYLSFLIGEQLVQTALSPAPLAAIGTKAIPVMASIGLSRLPQQARTGLLHLSSAGTGWMIAGIPGASIGLGVSALISWLGGNVKTLGQFIQMQHLCQYWLQWWQPESPTATDESPAATEDYCKTHFGGGATEQKEECLNLLRMHHPDKLEDTVQTSSQQFTGNPAVQACVRCLKWFRKKVHV